MNEKPEIKAGKSAVLTHKDGSTQSVKITFVDATGAKCVWQTALHAYACRFVPRAEFSRLQVFPDGVMFLVA